MKTTNKTSRSRSTTPLTSSTGTARGNMHRSEIQPLAIAARRAFDFQRNLGNLDTDDFNTWRHEQCMAVVGKPGLTACFHDHYRPLMAHFQTLVGNDTGAFQNLVTTGKATDRGPAEDTHEKRRNLASVVVDLVTAHLHLATTPATQLAAEARAAFDADLATLPADDPFRKSPWEASNARTELNKRLSRKAWMEQNGKTPITEGYVVYIVRQKTRRPNLSLGRDLLTGLAERCSVYQLTQLVATIQNRINATEGVGSTRDRNKSQRRPARRPSSTSPVDEQS